MSERINNISEYPRCVNQAQTLKFPYKVFVKGVEEKNLRPGVSHIKNVLPKRLNGKDARDFYESVINTAGPSNISTVNLKITEEKKYALSAKAKLPTHQIDPPSNRKDARNSVPKFSKNELLLAIENDNSKLLRSALNQGYKEDIIYHKDRYGWNSLMVAACAGSFETIKLLLENGANVHEVDKAGNTCLSLARKNRHLNIVSYINLHTSGRTKENVQADTLSENTDTETNVENHCDLCDVDFYSDRLSKRHFSSMVHLLNRERKELELTGGHPKVHYVIPEANRGFQMMLSKGWDSNVGLGPSGEGKLYPVKTVLKRDKHGLGLEAAEGNKEEIHSKRPKVTHFGPRDSSSVKNVTSLNRRENMSTISKKHRIAKEKRTKAKEINFRRDFMN